MNIAQPQNRAYCGYGSDSCGVGTDETDGGRSSDDRTGQERGGEVDKNMPSAERAETKRDADEEVRRQGETAEDLDCFDVFDSSANEVLDSYDAEGEKLRIDDWNINRSSFRLDAFSLRPEEILAQPVQADVSDAPISLPKWIELEKERLRHEEYITLHQASLLRKLCIAYGVGSLLSSRSGGLCSVCNFAVRESSSEMEIDSGWGVIGIDMIEPSLSVQLITKLRSPDNGSGEDSSDKKHVRGRYVRATGVSVSSCAHQDRDEMLLCREFGELLHELFSGECALRWKAYENHRHNGVLGDNEVPAPLQKKKSRDVSFSQATISVANGPTNKSTTGELKDAAKLPSLDNWDCPSSISQLADDLLSCADGLFRPDTAFTCITEALDEIVLLLEQPNKFLQPLSGVPQPRATNGKIFGRSVEISKLADVYHRVAMSNKGEVILISGYSGYV